MKTLSRFLLVAAASSLAIAPVAAQAGTRASEGASFSAVSAQGLGSAARGESGKDASTILLALLASGLLIAGIITATSSNDNGQSPGR